MKKWFNTILFGDNKTKGIIGAIIVCSVLTIVLAVFSITQFSFFYGIAAVFFGVADAVILQKYSLEDTEYEMERKESEELSPLEDSAEETEQKDIEISWKPESCKSQETIYSSYGEKEIEEILKKYKVKQEHRRIIIDHCACFRIRQCPAYIWKDKKRLYLLLIEKEPRRISIPLKEITDIYYEGSVPVKGQEEYELFHEPSYIASLFSPFLPQYFEKLQENERKKFKNLYVIGPKLSVTNTSARNLFDILQLEFSVEDTVMESSRFSPYFKLAYKSYILLRDRVIGTEEYKDRIKLILTTVAVGEDSEDEYYELICQMVENKLITKEYGDYYREMKDEL